MNGKFTKKIQKLQTETLSMVTLYTVIALVAGWQILTEIIKQ